MSDTTLKLKVEAGKDFFHVYDITGKYGKKNKGGWGSPNDKVSDVKTAKVNVYLPGESTYTEVSVTPYLPNNECIGIEIIPNDLSLDEFPPGIYRFDFIVDLYNGLTFSSNCYIFFWQPLDCCVSKKRNELSIDDVTSDKAKKVFELEQLLENVRWAACAGNLDGVKEISDYIWTNCGCCC